jgi:UDP-galactopyranose mutase
LQGEQTVRTLDLVVLSHLRWGFVYQRPQHLLSRLARTRRVFFIEEPIADASAAPYWEFDRPLPNLTVCRLHTPGMGQGFTDEQLEHFQPAIRELIDEQGLEEYAAWFYTPMALPLLDSMDPQAIVYDCMDELSGFLNAPPALVENERKLLSVADLVFTGGPSLYRAKQNKHPRVYCFSSSVDAAHFAKARAGGGLEEPSDQQNIAHPRLGYFGVIDERIDLPLLDGVAAARPDWQIVMVGPVVKIDPATLPQRPNLHYLGGKKYDELPQHLAGWDVCLMPFARNDATRFISPTKTLEYMAAEKPIVSTPITDVAEPYGDVVYLADTVDAFVSACESAMNESPDEHEVRAARMRDVLSRTSWDATASQMATLIDKLGTEAS